MSRIVNIRPRLRLGGWLEAARARRRSAIWDAFERIDLVDDDAADLARRGLDDGTFGRLTFRGGKSLRCSHQHTRDGTSTTQEGPATKLVVRIHFDGKYIANAKGEGSVLR